MLTIIYLLCIGVYWWMSIVPMLFHACYATSAPGIYVFFLFLSISSMAVFAANIAIFAIISIEISLLFAIPISIVC